MTEHLSAHEEANGVDVSELSAHVETLFPKRLTPKQRAKVGVLAALVIGMAVLTWFSYAGILNTPFSRTLLNPLLYWGLGGFLAFFFLLASVSMVGVLVHDRWLSRTLLTLAALSQLIWFRYGWYSASAVVLVLIAFLYYDLQIKEEESMRIKFSVSKSVRFGLTPAISLCLLAFSLTFYGHTIHKQQLAGSTLSPISEILGNTANQVLALQVPDYDPKETVDDFLYRVMVKEAQKPLGTVQESSGDLKNIDLTNPSAIVDQLSETDFQNILQKLPPDIRAQVGNDPQALKDYIEGQGNALLEGEFVQTRNRILSDLGVVAQGSTPIGEVIKQLVGNQFQKILGPYEMLIPPLLALTIFFALSIFTFVYAFCIKLIADLLFAIIKAANFVEIRTIETKVEVATLGE